MSDVNLCVNLKEGSVREAELNSIYNELRLFILSHFLRKLRQVIKAEC